MRWIRGWLAYLRAMRMQLAKRKRGVRYDWRQMHWVAMCDRWIAAGQHRPEKNPALRA